jgi:hypothetical protein
MNLDAKNIGPVHKTLRISEYAGKRPITTLAAFPVRFLKNPEDVVAGLVNRGKRLRELTPLSHRRYRGPAIDEYVLIDNAAVERQPRFECRTRTSDVVDAYGHVSKLPSH